MKILIIGAPRCGTTTLTKALSELLNLKAYIEPWNCMYGTNMDNLYTVHFGDDIVLKITIEQIPLDIEDYDNFIKEYYKLFDKVILLGRKDLQTCSESFVFQRTYDEEVPQFWHENYVYDEELDTTEIYEQYEHWMYKLIEVSHFLNLPVTWYEDLYSGNENTIQDCIKSWGIDIKTSDLLNYVHPSKRYRRFN